MNRIVLAMGLSVCFVGAARGQGSLPAAVAGIQTTGGIAASIYDSFNRPVIDPQKWDPAGGWSDNTFEMVREIRGGHLRLGQRTYGNRWADNGSEFDISQVSFKNPETITSLGTRVVVTHADRLSCANNSFLSDPEVQLIGNFFHTGEPSNDTGNIDASMRIVFTAPNAPLTVRLSVQIVGVSEFGGVDLGTVKVGEEVFLFVRWDRANGRFVGGMKKVGVAPVTASIPYAYALDDSIPPVFPYKGISVRNNAANCFATPTFSSMEAFFDDAMINVPWEP